nr:MAG TPA: hypothetical protein [Caudoviricetes sp.]
MRVPSFGAYGLRRWLPSHSLRRLAAACCACRTRSAR